MQYSKDDITAIILAGGLGRRLKGQNKGLVSLSGKTLLEHVIGRLKPQTQHIIINANRDIAQYQAAGFPVIKDKYQNHQGPLAGILSCKNDIKTTLVLTVPCDTPLLPKNILSKMLDVYNKNTQTQLCVAFDGTRLQNLFLLFHIEQFAHLNHFFTQNNRKVNDWIHSQTFTEVDFSSQAAQFVNINTPEALVSLQDNLDDQHYD